ncbi:hypothetical protein P5673_008814 [Acropora cervicornis]|uniref:Uncharacterized protein n=1 Tax=Acropora cervicornis TaxID=6130 RepID=A0AAD9VA79_ACRCE|nr:hypothetical protein P5673_008814 [Acropora cervicornis]
MKSIVPSRCLHDLDPADPKQAISVDNAFFLMEFNNWQSITKTFERSVRSSYYRWQELFVIRKDNEFVESQLCFRRMLSLSFETSNKYIFLL